MFSISEMRKGVSMRLEANQISFRYGRYLPWIFQKLDFAVESDERVGIFAPSGHGKTTLAMALSGYNLPTSGSVLLDGKPLPKQGICPVQLIYQHPEQAIDPRWRLKRVLEESGALQENVLNAFGIQLDWLDRFPRELSGGELQRFCAARALMSGAKFLICDEISTMLDVITQAQLWELILTEAEKQSMGLVVITHNLKLAKRVCTRIFDLPKCAFL